MSHVIDRVKPHLKDYERWQSLQHQTIPVYIDILENVFIPSTENWFGDHEVIFEDVNVSCQKGNRIKMCVCFFQQRGLTLSNNCSDLNQAEIFSSNLKHQSGLNQPSWLGL